MPWCFPVLEPSEHAWPRCRDADLEDAVEDAVDSGRPFLGICVGMQMLFDSSAEDDSAVGLGIIPGSIRWLGSELPRPQMQWNLLTLAQPQDPMFAGLSPQAWVYFVHSLHAVPADPTVVAATCTYGGVVNAAFRQGNVFATQFHPEKSGAWGVAMLGNFVRLVSETSTA